MKTRSIMTRTSIRAPRTTPSTTSCDKCRSTRFATSPSWPTTSSVYGMVSMTDLITAASANSKPNSCKQQLEDLITSR